MEIKPLTPHQEIFVQEMSNPEVNLLTWVAPIRGGKSVAGAIGMVDRAVRDWYNDVGNGTYIVAGATSSSFARNNEEYLQTAADMYGLPFTYRGTSKPHYDFGLFKFYIFGGENKRSFYTLRGLTATAAWIDEATLVDEHFVETAIERCSFDNSQVVLTTNADKPTHWLKRNYIDNPSDKFRLITTDFFENVHYSDVRRQDLLSLNPNTVNYKRAIQNMWAGEEGLIMPITADHLSDETYHPAGDVYLDPGTASVCAAILVTQTEYGWLIADEYYWLGDKMGRRTDEEHLNAIKDMWQIRKLVIDPAGASMRASATKMGYAPLYAYNDFEEGVQVVNNAMYAGKIKIHKQCYNLQQEASSYMWNTGLSSPVTGAPDHLQDLRRYMAMDKCPGFSTIVLAG